MTELLNQQNATEQAAARTLANIAARWEPWATVILVMFAVFVIGDAILQPLLWSLTSDGYYPMERAIGHVRDNVLATLPAYPLLYALWVARSYLGHLRLGALLAPASQRAVMNVGIALVAAGLLGALAPPFRSVLYGQIQLDPDMAWLAVGGVGFVIVIVGRVTASIASVALALKRENEQFV
ncbi:MAG: hypothetical protein AAFX44_17210 [Pseudomonadota bacterium]